jgi:hypothetical protein
MTRNGELGRTWKEEEVVYFQVLYKHLHGRAEENTRNIRIAHLWVEN